MPKKEIQINMFEGLSQAELDFVENVEFNDLNDDMKTLASRYGLELVLDMMVNFGGFSFYFPKMTNFCERAMARYINKRLSEDVSFKTIAIELKTSEAWVQKIYQQHNRLKEPSLFDSLTYNGNNT